MSQLCRTVMLGVFATLSTYKCMVSHASIANNMVELTEVVDTLVLSSTLACNMLRMKVVQKNL